MKAVVDYLKVLYRISLEWDYPVSGPSIVSGTSRKWKTSSNHCTATFGHTVVFVYEPPLESSSLNAETSLQCNITKWTHGNMRLREREKERERGRIRENNGNHSYKETNNTRVYPKYPDWVDNEIYAYNNKHSLRSNRGLWRQNSLHRLTK